MARADHDVCLCYRAPEGNELAGTIAAGLGRRGFRVLDAGRVPSGIAGRPADRDVLVAGAADLVVVVTPDVFASDAVGDGCRKDVADALRAGKDIVCVYPPGQSQRSFPFPSELAPLARSYGVSFDPARPAESIALVAHALSSDITVSDRRVMRLAKRLFIAAGLILVVGIALQEIPLLVERWSRPTLLGPVPPFTLYWSAVAQRLAGNEWTAVPLQKGTRVVPGDLVRVVFSPSADGYAYVVAVDVRGDVSVLFPTDAINGASRVRAGTLYGAPVGGQWLAIDGDAGLDAIYLVAGYDPLQNLEELIEEPEATTTAAARRELLSMTVQGLLDGRHGAAERRVWTGKLHPIDQDLAPRPAGVNASATLTGGRAIDLPLAAQRGLVSSSVELKVRFERAVQR